MFRTRPSLTPEQFRWLKELRSRASLTGSDIPEPVRGQLAALDYIEDRDGRATMTRPGVLALGAYRGPLMTSLEALPSR